MAEVSFVRLPSDECHWTFTDDKSTFVHVMAYCSQATSHHLSPWWLRFLTPCDLARQQHFFTYHKGKSMCLHKTCLKITFVANKHFRIIVSNVILHYARSSSSFAMQLSHQIKHTNIIHPYLGVPGWNCPVADCAGNQVLSNLIRKFAIHGVNGQLQRRCDTGVLLR